jgi:DNA-binding transcriptional regulator YiaG
MKHKEFAKTLVAWRERNDYTQQDAADKLGVSRRSLENWEQERAMPQGFGLQAMLKTIKDDKAPQEPKPRSRKRAKRQR